MSQHDPGEGAQQAEASCSNVELIGQLKFTHA